VRVDFLIPSLKKVQKELGVKIIGIGPPGEFMKSSGLKVKLVKILSYGEFKSFLSSIDNAIGVIPLDDSLFSSCKSPIKFFDYSLAGIPTIASDVPPYRDHIQQNKNGLLVKNDTEAWFEAMTSLIKEARLRKKIGLNAFNYTTTHFNADIRLRLWTETLENLVPDINLARTNREKIKFHDVKLKRLKNLLIHFINPKNYFRALVAFKNEGIIGVKKRVMKNLKAA
jgi:glycosyltransferase involved in cell wall biosynthesis